MTSDVSKRSYLAHKRIEVEYKWKLTNELSQQNDKITIKSQRKLFSLQIQFWPISPRILTHLTSPSTYQYKWFMKDDGNDNQSPSKKQFLPKTTSKARSLLLLNHSIRWPNNGESFCLHLQWSCTNLNGLRKKTLTTCTGISCNPCPRNYFFPKQWPRPNVECFCHCCHFTSLRYPIVGLKQWPRLNVKSFYHCCFFTSLRYPIVGSKQWPRPNVESFCHCWHLISLHIPQTNSIGSKQWPRSNVESFCHSCLLRSLRHPWPNRDP